MNIKKGDLVQIIIGKDAGKRGKVINADPKKERIVVEGVNLYKKHQKPKKAGDKGEIVSFSRPLNVSDAMLICGSCDKPTRIGRRLEGEIKSRYCKKCKAII